jgi:hypothetical protein
MWGIVIGGLITITASWLFSLKATKELKIAIRVLAGYLEGTIKGGDISFNRNKAGDVIGLNIRLHPDPISSHSHVAGNITLISDEKKSE